mgnify:CR=1 FL=1
MNNRMLTVVGMFVVSVFIGRQMFATTEVIQAQPVMPSIVELPNFPKVIKEEKKSVDEINVEVDLSTLEVSVKGTTDAIVNVKTIGEPKPIVKWRTKTIEKEVASGYPYIKSVGTMPDSVKAISPLSKVNTIVNLRVSAIKNHSLILKY